MFLIIADDGTTGSRDEWLDDNADDRALCHAIRALQAGDSLTLDRGAMAPIVLHAAHACAVCYAEATRFHGDANAGQHLCERHYAAAQH